MTLLEIVVSILLTAVMVSSIFTVSLTAKTSGGAADRKLLAGLATRTLSNQLKNFVTAYWDYAGVDWISTSINDIAGPASPSSAGAGSWQWSTLGIGDASPCCPASSTTQSGQSKCYALCEGQHTLTGYFTKAGAGWFEQAPYNATVVYTVTKTANYGTGGWSPTTSIAITWNEP